MMVGPAERRHTHCLICGNRNPWSLGLQFHADEAGRVCGEFQPTRDFRDTTVFSTAVLLPLSSTRQ